MVSNRLFSRGSAKAIINKHYTKKDGTASIYIQVIIDRQKKNIDLGLSWPPHKFVNGICKPRKKIDDDYSDFNHIIQDALSKAYQIFKHYRLINRPLTIEQFLYDYQSNFSADDFLAYMEKRIKKRARSGIISAATEKSHLSVLSRLKRFCSPLPFQSITNRTAENFDVWMIKKDGINSINTRWNQHTRFKTYLNEAKKDGFEFIDPYKDFKVKQAEGKFEALTKKELSNAWTYYSTLDKSTAEARIIGRFLFMCFTGLRISDARQFSPDDHLVDQMIILEMIKTKKDEKLVKIPCSQKALQLIDDALAHHPIKPFASPNEVYSNKKLKELALKMGIKKRLHHHMGRETFATLYMENGGALEVLQEILGHHDISMSRKYIKVSDDRKMSEAERINSMI
jgi:integrase